MITCRVHFNSKQYLMVVNLEDPNPMTGSLYLEPLEEFVEYLKENNLTDAWFRGDFKIEGATLTNTGAYKIYADYNEVIKANNWARNYYPL